MVRGGDTVCTARRRQRERTSAGCFLIQAVGVAGAPLANLRVTTGVIHLTTTPVRLISTARPAPSGLLAFSPAIPICRTQGRQGRRRQDMTGLARTSAGLDERRRRLLFRS